MEQDAELALLRRRHRQRMIGVSLLALAAVLSIPWLLEQSRIPKALQPQTQAVKVLSDQPGSAAVAPLPAPTPPVAASAMPVPEAAPAPPVAAQPAVTVTEEAVELPPKAAAATPTVAKPKAVPAVDGASAGLWVQVGVFAHHDRVLMLDKKLRKLGFTPSVETLEHADGTPRWRVRIGPFAGTRACNQALHRLAALGVKGMALP